VSAGLVQTEPDLPSGLREEPDPLTRITITRRVPEIQQALGISIRELARIDPEASMWVTPIFGMPDWQDPVLGGYRGESSGSAYLYDLFVLMPFESALKPVYEDHIRAVAQELNLRVARADDDDFFSAMFIVEQIWSAIVQSKAIVADCTGKNPNVFYEMGIAHTLGKPVVLITQNEDDVPFDLRHIRYIHYEYTPRGMKEFEANLKKTLENLLDDTPSY
jgi:hypothetical protein